MHVGNLEPSAAPTSSIQQRIYADRDHGCRSDHWFAQHPGRREHRQPNQQEQSYGYKSMLNEHIKRMSGNGKVIKKCTLPGEAAHGTFVAPVAIEIDDIGVLKKEVFGPVLHVIRYRGNELEAAMDAVNATGFGLTT